MYHLIHFNNFSSTRKRKGSVRIWVVALIEFRDDIIITSRPENWEDRLEDSD